MSRFGRGSPLGIVALLAALMVGLIAAFTITSLWPQALVVGIVLACSAVVLVIVGTPIIVGRTWVLWLAVPALALTGLGAVMLAEDIGVSRTGELTEVMIVDHTVDVESVHDSNSRRGREAHTHEYTVERTDGTPIAQPIIYRGEDGYDDFDTGDTITALVDPSGNAPTEPADSVNFVADAALLIIGFVAVTGVYGMCTLLVLLRPRKN